jgi:RNA ligase (TIGR02306 family)
MATFEVKVLPVKIETHPNADALEVARIGDFRAIVRKGDFGNGDHVAYIPEGAVVPADVLEEMGLTGRLAGP